MAKDYERKTGPRSGVDDMDPDHDVDSSIEATDVHKNLDPFAAGVVKGLLNARIVGYGWRLNLDRDSRIELDPKELVEKSFDLAELMVHESARRKAKFE